MNIDAPTKPAAAERPTVIERLTSASTSSNLSVDPEKRGDADYLIAAGLQPAKLGRLVYQLLAEWDARPKPRPLTDQQLAVIAEKLPRKSRGRLDMVGARIKEAKWQGLMRMDILRKLPTFKRLVDPHAGFLPWVQAKGIQDGETKLADVLLWWCDRKCPTCGGVKLGEIATCDACKGFGTREVPHDAEGLKISEHIASEVDQSRRGAVGELRQMRARKEWAAGKESVTLRPKSAGAE
ncbi:hypothetical protein [Delftia tsuruhatensis]|uniref:Uncharacterized protein n=1 Tax=Delftia tsuruhatensis TaxID=180282 RepID=A0ABN4SGQ5_9BURK|nr:hypothetical protein [Delftia tsuruhatensis]AOV02770.1 hypothetical protein BI380_16200 [Delftia tsuruhatensis]